MKPKLNLFTDDSGEKDKLAEIQRLAEKYAKPAAELLASKMNNELVKLYEEMLTGSRLELKKYEFYLDPKLKDES